MGRLYHQHFPSSCTAFYRCIHCKAEIADAVSRNNQMSVYSVGFQPAHLYSHTLNLLYGPAHSRELVSGIYVVCDVFCNGCDAKLGWQYIDIVDVWNLDHMEEAVTQKKLKVVIEDRMLELVTFNGGTVKVEVELPKAVETSPVQPQAAIGQRHPRIRLISAAELSRMQTAVRRVSSSATSISQPMLDRVATTSRQPVHLNDTATTAVHSILPRPHPTTQPQNAGGRRFARDNSGQRAMSDEVEGSRQELYDDESGEDDSGAEDEDVDSDEDMAL